MRDGRPIEKIFQKKTQLEHILLRPDSYVGSIEMQKDTLWVFDNDKQKLQHREIRYAPGLFKIFDEILVNAADNYQRDKSMDEIRVTIDPENNRISVRNNGSGIPIEIHKDEKVYVPELIFGQLLTSSNYDDDEKKVTGGRNGYGAKLTNIFSKVFIVETADKKVKKYFKQVYTGNMSHANPPEISPYKEKEEFTCITFEPDLARFKMKNLDTDIVSLMTKRVYDMAGVTPPSVKVYLNDQKIEIKDFKAYVDMFLESDLDADEEKPEIVYDKYGDRWEIGVCLSEGQFQQVSYCNAISTSKGGTHVNYITEMIVDYVKEACIKTDKKSQIKPHQIRQHLWIFVKCLVENPSFDSQTKENMTLKKELFGSTVELKEKFLKKVLATDIVKHCLKYEQTREELGMKRALNTGGKKLGRLYNIPKLDDANKAGSKESQCCTLILTEGDSAKSLAMAGLEIVGREYYGVFPLRGKMLNVREASNKKIKENEEVQNLMKILGLKMGYSYEEVKELRYGSIMIMTDQDNDGSHIKGLIINFINFFWPSLFKINGFIKEFITPIIKATRNSTINSFYTIPEYKNWVNTLNGNTRGWKIKYYKGLGTSSTKEAKEYFDKLERHRILFEYENEKDTEAIDLVFNKSKTEDRKNWLANFNISQSLQDTDVEKMTYEDFINKEFILFSIDDNKRSIPCICDGLKPSERKILFACFKRNLKEEIKVGQLSGYVAENSAYHHGEQSLNSTIVGLAQNFVGSNNINLLMPNGQFGTRNQGGKDDASARYIFTTLNKITRHLFNKDDDPILDYLQEEGQKIEPHWYLPILPMILVNGAEGIGTGWSTSIPCYNVRDIVNNLKNKMKTGIFLEMHPWYKGFTGDIIPKPGGYTVSGKFDWMIQDDANHLHITELPIFKWTKDYKEYLNKLMGVQTAVAEKPKDKKSKKKKVDEEEEREKKEKVILEDFKEYHTTNKVDFRIKFLDKFEEDYKDNNSAIVKKFKLQTSISTTNMVLFDKDNKIRRYANVIDIMEQFYILRLEYYQKRKNMLVSTIKSNLEKASNQVRFILAVINEEIVIRRVKKTDLVNTLHKAGYMPISKINKIRVLNEVDSDLIIQEEGEVDEQQVDQRVGSNGMMSEYDYLLNMALLSLTEEHVNQLIKHKEEITEQLNILLKTTEEELWQLDLDRFIDVLNEVEADEEKERIADELKQKNKEGKKQRGGGKGGKRGKAAVLDDDNKTGGKAKGGKGKKTDENVSQKTEPAKKQNNLNPFLEPMVKSTTNATATALQENKAVNMNNLSLKERIALKNPGRSLGIDPDIASLHDENRKRRRNDEDLDDLIFPTAIAKVEPPVFGKKSKMVEDDEDDEDEVKLNSKNK